MRKAEVRVKEEASCGLVNAWVAHSFNRTNEPLPGVTSKRIIAHGVGQMYKSVSREDARPKYQIPSAYGHSNTSSQHSLWLSMALKQAILPHGTMQQGRSRRRILVLAAF